MTPAFSVNDLPEHLRAAARAQLQAPKVAPVRVNGIALGPASPLATEPNRRRKPRPLEPVAPPSWSVTREADGSTLLVLPEPPTANLYWRHVGVRVVLSAKAKAYRETVSALCAAGRPNWYPTEPIALIIDWHRAAQRGDLDNHLKVAIDALRGLVYGDDKQIVKITATRHEAPRKGNLIVRVSPVAIL